MLDSRDPMMRVAWPSGNWGSLPLDGGIEVGHRHELREAEKQGKKEDLYKQLEAEYLRLMNPVRYGTLILCFETIMQIWITGFCADINQNSQRVRCRGDHRSEGHKKCLLCVGGEDVWCSDAREAGR